MESVQINNIRQARKIGFVFTLVSVAMLGVLLSTLLIEMENALFIQVISMLILIVNLTVFKAGGFDYIMIEYDEKKIEIKYYSVFPFGRKFRMIKANMSDLGKIEISRGILGMRRGLLLFQKSKNGLAKYPVVWITALNSSDLKQIKSLTK